MRLNIVLPMVSNYLGRGSEYVHKAARGIRAHMPPDINARYWVITDDPTCAPDFVTPLKAPNGAIGWWVTLSCFKPEILPQGERCVYFDLDILTTGQLDFLHYDGPFSMMADPYWPKEHVNSSVTMWTAGEADKVWTIWERAGMPTFSEKGDQFWTEQVFGFDNIVKAQDMFPGQIVSYKADCRPIGKLPDNARICVFHGRPRPHETTGWAQELWERA